MIQLHELVDQNINFIGKGPAVVDTVLKGSLPGHEFAGEHFLNHGSWPHDTELNNVARLEQDFSPASRLVRQDLLW